MLVPLVPRSQHHVTESIHLLADLDNLYFDTGAVRALAPPPANTAIRGYGCSKAGLCFSRATKNGPASTRIFSRVHASRPRQSPHHCLTTPTQAPEHR